jgi:hypothetical protein
MPVASVARPVESDAPLEAEAEHQRGPDAVVSALKSALEIWSSGRDVRSLRRALLAVLGELEEG